MSVPQGMMLGILLWYVGRPIPIADCPGKVSVGVSELRWWGPGPTSELHHPILSIDLEDAGSISGATRGDRVETRVHLIIFGTPTPFIGALLGFQVQLVSFYCHASSSG